MFEANLGYLVVFRLECNFVSAQNQKHNSNTKWLHLNKGQRITPLPHGPSGWNYYFFIHCPLLSWINWCSLLKVVLLFWICCFILFWFYLLYWRLFIWLLQARSQDTLNSIALKFNITPNKLVELNKLFTHTIVPGQVIIFVLNITLEILPSFFFAVSNDLVLMS